MRKCFMLCVAVAVVMFSMNALAQDAPTTSAEQKSARELLEQGLTVEPGATANVNLNEVKVDVPSEMAVTGDIAADVQGTIDAVVTGKLKVTRADRGFCERNPMTCVLGGVAIVAAGCLAADQLGAFDSTNSVEFQK